MTESVISKELIQQTIHFHGHSCPGLAIGIRAAEIALAEFGQGSDEGILAVVETDMCAVDAIQYLTGCTFGKGNLIHLDYGKNAFTFYSRQEGKGIRILTRSEALRDQEDELNSVRKKLEREELTPEEQDRMAKGMEARTRRIMEASPQELFQIKPAQGPMPRKARILASLTCQACGEPTMESRTRRFLGQTLCIPCFEAADQKH